MAELQRREEEIKEEANRDADTEIFQEEKMLSKTLYSDYVMSENEEISTLCDVLKINATEVRIEIKCQRQLIQ